MGSVSCSTLQLRSYDATRPRESGPASATAVLALGRVRGDGETETVDSSTIADPIAAYRVLEGDSNADVRFCFEAAQTVVALSTGLGRGELLWSGWQDLELLERRLSVV